MVSSYAVHASFIVTASLLNWGLVYWVWRRAEDRTGQAMLLAVVGQALWMTSATVKFFVYPEWLKYSFTLLGYCFGWLIPIGWFLFGTYYTNRRHWLTPTVLGVVGGTAAVNLAVLVTDPIHGIVYADQQIVTEPFRHLVTHPSVPWILSTGSSFVIMGIGIGLLLYAMVRSRRVSRRQPLLISLALVPNAVVYVAQNFGYVPVKSFEYTSVTWILFAGVLGYTYFSQDLLRITPVTRGTVMESVSDGIIVVDETERIVDYNQAAADLFPIEGRLGEPLSAVVPALVDGEAPDGFAEEITRVVDGERLHLRVDPAPTSAGAEVTGYTLSVRDITALRERTEDLEQQTEQLDQFASVVSHDLRNPLSVAQGYTAELQRRIETAGSVEDPERVVEVQASLDRMETIIDDALTLAREGQAIEERSLTSLRAIVDSAWRTAEVGDATLVTELDEGVHVYADRNRLQTLFENVFRNSAEHGGEDVTVRVGTVENGFYVEDDGPGIPAEHREAVFESGFTTGGTGLGLAIVDRIVDAHGWSVRVEDGSEGGARFVVSGIDLTRRAGDDGPGSDHDRVLTGSESAPATSD